MAELHKQFTDTQVKELLRRYEKKLRVRSCNNTTEAHGTGDEQAMENLAWYIIWASFSQERMRDFPEDSKVVYRSKNGKEEKALDALESLEWVWGKDIKASSTSPELILPSQAQG